MTLTTETSTRIGIEAERRGIDRSALIDLLCAEALKHIVVSIRHRDTGQVEEVA